MKELRFTAAAKGPKSTLLTFSLLPRPPALPRPRSRQKSRRPPRRARRPLARRHRRPPPGGLPLTHPLPDRAATLVWSGTTAPASRFAGLPNTTPPEPGLTRVSDDTGAAIGLEVRELSASVTAPLCIGTVTLATGDEVKGFLGEPHALTAATDITGFGGWRAYLASR